MKGALLVVLMGAALFFIAATLIPLIRHDQWWIRIFDFPRMQVTVLGVLVAVALLRWGEPGLVRYGLAGLLLLCMMYQAVRMYPYTILGPKQVDAAAPADTPDLTLLVANVLMTNRQADRLMQIVEAHDPDVIITLEPDAWWEQQLRRLEDHYPHTIKEPLDNTYGMLLHSRLPLIDPAVEYLVEPAIPSMRTYLKLRSGLVVRLYSIHPKPPYPREAKDTTERDAELLVVARRAAAEQVPTVVAGDFNDVAWSYTTDLFQQISQLLDPRRGRGPYSTFHANWPLLRVPLDHVFHSAHFKLIALARLDTFGSDHLPILVRLQYDPAAPHQQQEPEADQEEQQEAQEKIEKAKAPT